MNKGCCAIGTLLFQFSMLCVVSVHVASGESSWDHNRDEMGSNACVPPIWCCQQYACVPPIWCCEQKCCSCSFLSCAVVCAALRVWHSTQIKLFIAPYR